MFTLLAPAVSSSAVWEELQIYDYKLVPYIEFTYIELRPGDSTEAQRTILNRYNFSMENASLEMELYRYRTLRESLDPSNVRDPPIISDEGGQTFTVDLGNIGPNETASFAHPVLTTKKTPQATYLIRVALEFQANGTLYTMKSRGHFSSELWADAIANQSVEREVNGQNITTGGIDLDVLGVDGIMAETSITIYKPLSKIPLVIMAAITGFVGLAALVFYLQEEKNMFPQAEWAYQRIMGRWLITKLRVEEKLKKK